MPWMITSAAFALEVPKVFYDYSLGSPVVKAPSCPDKIEKFFIAGKVNAEKLSDFGSTTIWVTDDANKKCSVFATDVANQLKIKSQGFESLVEILSKFKPDAQEILSRLQVKILIDDLSKSPTRIFRFYNHDDKIIYLDCSLISQNYLYPSVAHEIAHAVLSNHNLEFWFEEMLTQLVENEFSGWVPRQSLTQLAQSPLLPSLFTADKDYGHWRDYAMSYLFGTYMFQYFGGYDIFRGILENLESGNSHSCQEHRERLFTAGRTYLKSKNAPDADVQRFTFAGLLRYFAVATHLNLPAFSFFRILGWEAPKESFVPQQKTFKLSPHQFIRIPVNTVIEKISAELEIYLVEAGPGSFQIFDRQLLIEKWAGRQPLLIPSTENLNRVLLVINPKDKDVLLFK